MTTASTTTTPSSTTSTPKSATSLDSPRPALVLDRTAFYPTSGGQVFDTGWITSNSDAKFRVTEVADTEDGRVVHYLEAPLHDSQQEALKPGNPHPRPDRRHPPPRPHAAALRTARALRGLHPPVQHADSLVPHGRRLLLHRSRHARADERADRIAPSASPTRSSSRTAPSTSAS